MTFKRSCALALLLLMLVASACGAEKGTETQPESTAESIISAASTPEETGFSTSIASVDDSGKVLLKASASELLDAGFAVGDLVIAASEGKEFEMPVGNSENDVTSGRMLLLLTLDKEKGVDKAELMINSGDFYAEKLQRLYQSGGGDGAPEGRQISIRMLEARGYYATWVKRSLKRTNDRADYPHLSDEEFANFRMVRTTGIGENKLYRSTSPIAPSLGRNGYADAACRNAGVKTVINLTDLPEEMTLYAGYADTYYAGLNILAQELETDFFCEHFKEGQAAALRFMADNEGPYLVHCVEGKDRTGFYCAVLEALAGASIDEIAEDYMLSFVNFYGVTKDDERYEAIAELNIKTSLKTAFELSDLESADLQAAARAYVKSIGITDGEIDRILSHLS